MKTFAQHICLVEPFFGGSHKQWLEQMKATLSPEGIEFSQLVLSDKFWKWRMHGAAVSLSDQANQLSKIPDLFLASDMLDVATFRGLLKSPFNQVPIALYFHENQLSYPFSQSDPCLKKKRDHHYAFINFTSALTANRIFFNSQYNRDSFLQGLKPFLSQFPPPQLTHHIQTIQKKSQILPLALDFPPLGPRKKDFSHPLIVWNHRWEYDKNPQEFFKLLKALEKLNIKFNLAILGEKRGAQPKTFDLIKSHFSKQLVHWGFVKKREDYWSLLCQASLVPVTSLQDFFGASALEAMAAGAPTLLPNRLAFPEHLKGGLKDLLYQDFDELIKKSVYWLKNPMPLPLLPLRQQALFYSWPQQKSSYLQRLKELHPNSMASTFQFPIDKP